MSAGDWKELLRAAQTGDVKLARYHLACGVDPNYQHPEFLTTPLIASIEGGHLAVAELLLENGADARLPAGFSADTPLVVAKRRRDRAAVRLLRRYVPERWRWWVSAYLGWGSKTW